MTVPGDAIVPPATIGMLGGGQLGKYAIVAANAMGYRTIVVDPSAAAPAGVVANEHIVAAYDAPAALDQLAEHCAVVTTEFEHAPAAALDALARGVRVAPTATSVAVAQDRIVEKTFMVDHDIAVGPFVALRAGDEIPGDIDALAAHGAVVKTARLGYDGKGQVRVANGEQVADAWAELGGVDCIVESLLDLRVEVSVLVGRTSTGESVTWPVAENVHVDGILDVSIVPARIDAGLADRAVALARSVADALDYVGVLAVEMFAVGDDELLVNEIAPRPHNSGHWTLDACRTCLF